MWIYGDMKWDMQLLTDWLDGPMQGARAQDASALAKGDGGRAARLAAARSVNSTRAACAGDGCGAVYAAMERTSLSSVDDCVDTITLPAGDLNSGVREACCAHTHTHTQTEKNSNINTTNNNTPPPPTAQQKASAAEQILGRLAILRGPLLQGNINAHVSWGRCKEEGDYLF